MSRTATQQAQQFSEAAPHDQSEMLSRFEDASTQPFKLTSFDAEQLQIQVVTARRYPRSIKQFLSDSLSMATISKEMAEKCFYSVPRAGKTISGPSIRLAEVCMSAWGHLDCGTKIKEIGKTTITVEGFAWDMQTNNKVRQEVQRNITNKQGARYNADMITTTLNAAASIALRNAILRIIPRSYVDEVMKLARQCAMGDIKTLAERREVAVNYFLKAGVLAEQIYAALEVAGMEDVTLEHLLTLTGFKTAIADNETTLDECFPPVVKPGEEKKPLAQKIKEAANGTRTLPEATVTDAVPTPKPKEEVPATKPDGEIIDPPAKPAAKQAKKPTYEPSTAAQHDEIDALLPTSGLTMKEAIAGQQDSTGSQIMSILQLSKQQASAVLAKIEAGIAAQKAKGEDE